MPEQQGFVDMLASYIIALHGALKLRFWVTSTTSTRFAFLYSEFSTSNAQPTVHRGKLLAGSGVASLANQRMQQGVKPVFLFRVGEDRSRKARRCNVPSAAIMLAPKDQQWHVAQVHLVQSPDAQ